MVWGSPEALIEATRQITKLEGVGRYFKKGIRVNASRDRA